MTSKTQAIQCVDRKTHSPTDLDRMKRKAVNIQRRAAVCSSLENCCWRPLRQSFTFEEISGCVKEQRMSSLKLLSRLFCLMYPMYVGTWSNNSLHLFAIFLAKSKEMKASFETVAQYWACRLSSTRGPNLCFFRPFVVSRRSPIENQHGTVSCTLPPCRQACPPLFWQEQTGYCRLQ